MQQDLAIFVGLSRTGFDKGIEAKKHGRPFVEHWRSAMFHWVPSDFEGSSIGYLFSRMESYYVGTSNKSCMKGLWEVRRVTLEKVEVTSELTRTLRAATREDAYLAHILAFCGFPPMSHYYDEIAVAVATDIVSGVPAIASRLSPTPDELKALKKQKKVSK